MRGPDGLLQSLEQRLTRENIAKLVADQSTADDARHARLDVRLPERPQHVRAGRVRSTAA